MDHANLQYFKELQKVNRQQARWFTQLADYNFTIHHIPRNKNTRADTLSRHADYYQGENNNENITLLPEHLFCAVLEGGSGDLIGAIAIAQHHLKAFKILNKGQDWSKDPKGIVRKWNKIFVPNDNEIIFEVKCAHHDSPVA